MNQITIKPHHFMDIIKLHGAGIETFVPDETMGHDFYKVANMIMKGNDVILNLTIEGDDICKPCKKFQDSCIDELSQIPGFTKKDTYNKVLDKRIISYYQLTQSQYTAKQLCQLLYQSHALIFKVWKEEDLVLTEKRHQLFVAGAEKYLVKFKEGI